MFHFDSVLTLKVNCCNQELTAACVTVTLAEGSHCLWFLRALGRAEPCSMGWLEHLLKVRQTLELTQLFPR
ncbi:hypothetical protein PO909_017380 [Leuciscus waleckii]